MPKVTLKFNLPEENVEFQLVIKGPNMQSALWDLSGYLRELLKNGHDFKTADEAVEKIRQKFME